MNKNVKNQVNNEKMVEKGLIDFSSFMNLL